MIKTPRLIANRYGVFAVRILIPSALTGTGKRKEHRISLGTKNPALARVLALQFNLQIEQTRMVKTMTIHDLQLNPYKLDV